MRVTLLHLSVVGDVQTRTDTVQLTYDISYALMPTYDIWAFLSYVGMFNAAYDKNAYDMRTMCVRIAYDMSYVCIIVVRI